MKKPPTSIVDVILRIVVSTTLGVFSGIVIGYYFWLFREGNFGDIARLVVVLGVLFGLATITRLILWRIFTGDSTDTAR